MVEPDEVTIEELRDLYELIEAYREYRLFMSELLAAFYALLNAGK